jgi:outer membrane protein OmpA-like peptidoglycan-associated protein
MFSNKKKNETAILSSSGIRRNFFGNQPQAGFFSAPSNTLQTQQAPALPEFSVNQFVNGNFANFDAQYDVVAPTPATGTLFISHGVHMNYPKQMTKDERTTFENDFKKTVHDGWSNKHLLTLTEPGFSPYQCNVDVTAHVEEKPNDAHTIIDVVKPKPTEKRFRPRVSGTKSKEGSETTHTAKLDFRDPSIEQETKINKPDFLQNVGNFGFDSDLINADCKEDIQKIKDFINSIPKPDDPEKCAFALQYVGRASSEGSAAYNKKLSEKRIHAVEKELQSEAGNCISIIDVAGETEATTDAEFRRVSVGVFVNDPEKGSQNMAAHEFGHMIGLGDEYVENVPEIPGSKAKFLGDKPTHFDAVKQIVGEDAANELIIQDSANIMAKGNEVKRGHYVMFVAALDIMTRPEIEKATGNKDAKWNVE